MSAEMVLLQLDVAGFRVLSALLSALWQSSILLLAAGVLSYALRNRNTAVRHAVWTVAVLAVPLLPLLSLNAERWSPAPEIAVIPAYAPPVAHIDAPEEPVPAESAPRDAGADAPLPPTPIPEPQQYPWAIGLTAYLLTVSALLLWTLAARLRIRRWILDGAPVLDERTIAIFAETGKRLGLSGEIPLLEHPDVPVPLVCRVFRPVVVLPAGFADDLSESELRAIALHELSHIKRRDTLVFGLAALVRAVFFFQPLLWYAARRVSYLAEIACDSAVLEHEGDPSAYAGLLTRVAAGLPVRALSTEMAAGILFSRSAFFRRVQEILSERRGKMRSLSRGALAGITGTGMVILLITAALPLEQHGTETGRRWIAGVVKDENGRRLRGVPVLVNKPGAWWTRTNFLGKFRVEIGEGNLEGGVVIHRKQGMMNGLYFFQTLPANEWITFVVPPHKERRLSGTVIDEQGKPVNGVLVKIVSRRYCGEAFDNEGNSLGRAGGGPINHALNGAITDIHGRFAIRYAIQDTVTVLVDPRVPGSYRYTLISGLHLDLVDTTFVLKHNDTWKPYAETVSPYALYSDSRVSLP